MAGSPIEAKGVAKTTHDLAAISKRAARPKDDAYRLRTIYRESNKARFGTKGRGAWWPLKESTQEWKARRNLDPRILRASNALYRSLTAPRASGQIDDRSKPDELRFGTDLSYAAYQKRKLIELAPDEQRKMRAELEHYIAKGHGGASL